MGQARRRGTFEERRAASIVKGPMTYQAERTDAPKDLSGIETRKVIMLLAGTRTGTPEAVRISNEVKDRARAGDGLAKQLLLDVSALSGGTSAAVRRRLHAWFAQHEAA